MGDDDSLNLGGLAGHAQRQKQAGYSDGLVGENVQIQVRRHSRAH
jgi:hypothetical protein